MRTEFPTPVAELNAVLQELVTDVQAILGDNFLAAYLQGSFAIGDWDEDSDVDFIVAIDQEIGEAELALLQKMHGRIYDRDTFWAKHLEGSYFPRDLLRRNDPAKTPLLYLDNTSRELIRSDHCNTLVVRWSVRECGITMAGCDPQTLIDPLSADDLRREVRTTMRTWAEEIFASPEQMDNRWFQSYAVLSYCRMLQTLETGRIESKRAGARWAEGAMDGRWKGLIQRAWEERPDPSSKARQRADADAVTSTMEFIRYALEFGRA